MKKSNIIRFLEALKPEEEKRFLSFLISPYTNGRKGLIEHFKVLQKYRADAAANPNKSEDEQRKAWEDLHKQKKLSKQQVLGGEKPSFKSLSANTFDSNNTYLCTAIKDFWVAEAMKKQPLLAQNHLINVLCERKLFDFVEADKGKLKQTPTQADSLEVYRLRAQKEYEVEKYNEAIMTRRDDTPVNLIAAGEALDVFFILNRIKYMCNILNHNRILNTTLALQSADELALKTWILQTSAKYALQYPLLGAYRLLFLMLENVDDYTAFDTVRQFVQQHKTHIDTSELHTIYVLLTNTGINMVNKTQNITLQQQYRIGVIQVYEDHLMANIALLSFSERDAIAKNWLKLNIAYNTHSTNKIGATTDLKKRFEALPKGLISDNMMAYCRAFIAFEEGVYIICE